MSKATKDPKTPGAPCPGAYQRRVIVKFKDFVQIPYVDNIEKNSETRTLGPWDALCKQYPKLHVKRLWTSLKPDKIKSLVAKASQLDKDYRPPNLLNFFAVSNGIEDNAEDISKILMHWPTVDYAYVEGGPVQPPLVNPADDPRWANQGYLDPAPDGIDAEYAWNFPGGDGQGQHFVDMEQGWTLNHEDLVAKGITLLSGVNQAYFGHGTAVLGEIGAVDNTIGCIGITPELAKVNVVSQYRSAAVYDTADAILDTVAALDFGDVLLLEAQTNYGGYSMVPVEVENAVFEAIRLGTALGITIVEAAGNGGNDLDAFTNLMGQQVLNRGSLDFRDSGAVMVGAASSSTPHTRMGFSNFGTRIDCYGWGENIDTTGDGWTGNTTTAYTSNFGGTSGASPMIAGAALALQGIAENDPSLGYRFSPGQMRTMLSDPATGTLSSNPPVDLIGVMPNLRAIIDGNVLNISPDLYIRDYVGDTGDPHSGSISASPDIILQPMPVAGSPQAAYGEGSGTENSNMLGFEAELGQDNYIYVRMRNRGGSAAANVTATVYWSPVSTLITPDLWNFIGTATLPNVNNGEVLTVSDAIQWTAAEIPAEGHYCFVGILGHPMDPAPTPADFMDWDNFRSFIRNNNNVTWRNFNVVDNNPPAAPGIPPGFAALPFIAPGAPDKSRKMRLEIHGKLPRGAKMILEMPAHLVDLFLPDRIANIDFDKKARVARLPLNPHGQLRMRDTGFPAKSRSKLRLLVKIPEKLRNYPYQVYAAQFYGDEELGRVTWQLTPRKMIDNCRKDMERRCQC